MKNIGNSISCVCVCVIVGGVCKFLIKIIRKLKKNRKVLKSKKRLLKN